MGPVGSYDFHVLYGAPNQINDLLKLVKPFNNEIWVFLMVSLVTVCISLILINKTYAIISRSPNTETTYQSVLYYRTI